MNKKLKSTLQDVFKTPVQSNVAWKDVENLLIGLGAIMQEGNGSRVRFFLNGKVAVFHRPHPRKEIDKGALISVRRFLITAGIKNDEI